ncbi:serine/threonine protein kinase [Thiococcus pfennigii]|uniref:serine/threonine protein kinase n=1 Tax=Thiococcus pfennigii TaxID=1057 RepID=UPI0019088878|nr:serine/threonine-protein kinase [Thiococcus pfennigii]MBK1700046.1 protein kinase [Thiococcus pfennigii]
MSETPEEKRCPRCGAVNRAAELPQRDYRCGDCGLELAHFTTLSTGAIRDVLGWLLDIGVEVQGRYRVTAVLGKGGFGVTYLVDDLLLHGKRRAMKEIPELLFDEYETRLLGRLHHPAIPDITDRFTAGGMIYLVLEFGGDRTLRIEQERRGGRIPLFVLLPWIRQLCAALQYLHEQDPPIVHRDLKPDNVLLDDGDRVMLIDFGIAKEAKTDTVTRTIGRAVSHGFSPPEQVLGTGTDARSDVYALGAILYNLLTGRMPPAAHERITGSVIEPLSTHLPEIPPLIEAAVMQALELNINLRQQSIGELAQVLDLVQSGSNSAATVSVAGQMPSQVPTGGTGVVLPSVHLPSTRSGTGVPASASVRIAEPPPAPAVRRPPWAAIGAGAVLILAVAGGAWWFLGSGDEAAPEVAGEGAVPARTAAPTEAAPEAAGIGVAGAPATAIPASPPAGAPAPRPSVPSTGQASVQDADLPSIFSDEQDSVPDRRSGSPRPQTAGPARDSGESLMDLFEKHRAEVAQEAPAAPAPEPVTPPAPPPAPAVPPPKPAQVAKTTPPPKPAAKPTAPPPAKAASGSDWGFEYKGATRKY